MLSNWYRAPAEYSAPAWRCSTHACKVDVPLNEAMRTITGCLHSTPLHLLHHLSGILPPNTKRNKLSVNLNTKAEKPDHPLHQNSHATARLKSRKPFHPFVDTLIQNDNDLPPIPNQLEPYTENFSKKSPGSHLPRKEWVQLNRLRTGVGCFAANMVKMGY